MKLINKQDCIIQEIYHDRVKVIYEPLEGINGYVLFDINRMFNKHMKEFESEYEINSYDFYDENGSPYEPIKEILDQFQDIIESTLL